MPINFEIFRATFEFQPSKSLLNLFCIGHTELRIPTGSAGCLCKLGVE